MVSIRRRKLLGLCSGRTSLAPLPQVTERGKKFENSVENTKSVSNYGMSMNDSYIPREGTNLEDEPGTSNVSASSSSQDNIFQHFPEVKGRKRHRRKQVENQEPCIMRGVYFKNSKWQAAIKVYKKQIHLGIVVSQEEAARLYDSSQGCIFMCGREPNFELSEEEKQQLRKIKWDEFLAFTLLAITNKISQRTTPGSQRKLQNNELEGEQGHGCDSASDDDTLVP